MKRGVHVLTGGRRGVKNLRTGLRLQGICDIHRERKERAKLNRKKMAPICQGSWADFCMLKELMALRSRGRNIDPLISPLFFKLWPAEHKCITNQFNPVILIQLCRSTWCAADTSASPTLESAWPGAQGRAKSPDLSGILTWQGDTSHGILTSGSETMEIFPTASYRLLNLPLGWYYPYSNEGSFLLFFDLSPVTFCWWTGSVPWVVGHKLTKMSKLAPWLLRPKHTVTVASSLKMKHGGYLPCPKRNPCSTFFHFLVKCNIWLHDTRPDFTSMSEMNIVWKTLKEFDNKYTKGSFQHSATLVI